MSTPWLSPRLLGLHVLAAIVVAACALMGLWQLGVYGSKHDDAAAAQASAKPVDLLSVWGPDDPFRDDLVGRRVRIPGRFDPARVISIRRPDGSAWLGAIIEVRGTASAILVVLGHAPAPKVMAPPPTFTAILQPPEPTGDLSIAHRVNEVGIDLFSGYALLDDPRYVGTMRPVRADPPSVSWTVGLRNLAYALQWWVFGLFAVFMWWRMAGDAVDVARGAAGGVADESGSVP